MSKADPYATKQDPDNIHQGTQAPGFIWFVYYFFSEGYERQHGKFQGLYPKRDPDNGQTEEKTWDDIHHKDD